MSKVFEVISAFDNPSVFFSETARRLGIGSVEIIEKDFWVVWCLNTIFDSKFAADLIFKGGTSLSKGFNLIERFSEDIDLTIDRASLGFNETINDIDKMSNNGQKKYFKEMKIKGEKYVQNVIRFLREEAGRLPTTMKFSIASDPADGQKVYFEYPSFGRSDLYIKPRVILEFGCRGAVFPCVEKTLTTYVEDALNSELNYEPCNTLIKFLKPERTFWEKATLLHMLSNLALGKSFGNALARHYYDLFMLSKSVIESMALKDIDLLRDVVLHKQIFFKSSWAGYEKITTEGIRLLPASQQLNDEIARDYHKMHEMFFSEPPSFSIMANHLKELENKINGLLI